MTSPFNYSYANNSDGTLINISQANRLDKYYCPICGSQMTPHMGKVRRWHFVHKNTDNCAYESYLHNLAKHKIKEAFLLNEPFYISYNAPAICSLTCPFVDSDKCMSEKPVKFDLRKYYDTCELEASYHNFRADILLASSLYPKRQPILIEIKVTHECTEDKIKDGVRIIEVPIYSESQIDYIVNNRIFSGKRFKESVFWGIKSKNDVEPIVLHNFDKVEQYDPRDSSDDWDDVFYRKDTIVFCLDKNGHFWSFDCHCFEVDSKVPQNVHYFVTNIATPFKEIFQGFSLRGVKIRNCFLCKFSKKDYYDERICVLYKKYNLPRKPPPSMALNCSYYREDIVLGNINDSEQDILTSYKTYFYICKDIM